MINKASMLLEEKHADVSNAVSTIIPSFLGVLLKKGHSPQLKNILEEAGSLHIESNIKQIFEGKPTKDQQNIGDNFLQHLLGDRAADFTNPIANHTGITKVAANRLISMVAPIVAGFLGNKIIKEKLTMPQLVEEIGKEKAGFEGLIPIDLIKSFDLYPKLHINNAAASNENVKAAAAAATNVHANTTSTANHPENKPEKPEETKKGKEWIMWIVLLVLLLLLFLCWRSCRGERQQAYMEQESVVVLEPEQMIPSSTIVILSLPGGVRLNAHAGGLEDRMVKRLESDEYQKATDKTLENEWFEFDNINFEPGSTTELQSGSKEQLENVIAILKDFKNAKIKIGAFANNVADKDLKMSEERAKTVESILEKGGVGSQIIKVHHDEGYAIRNASESDMAKAEGHDIALRLVK